MKNLEKMTSKELKVIAKELKVPTWWNLSKAALIDGIKRAQAKTDEETQQDAAQKAAEYKAMAAYDKDWKKYTDTYNPLEFIEKFRAGEITIEDEEPVAEKPKRRNRKASARVEDPKPETKADETPATTEQPTPKRGALIEYDGRSQNICKWGEELGISPNTLYGRLYKMGWTVERAFTTPGKKK